MSNDTSSANHNASAMEAELDAARTRYRSERDKRLRADANEQYVEVKGDFSRYIDDPYVEPGFTSHR